MLFHLYDFLSSGEQKRLYLEYALVFFCPYNKSQWGPILFWAPVALTGVFKALLLGKIQSIIHNNISSSENSILCCPVISQSNNNFV